MTPRARPTASDLPRPPAADDGAEPSRPAEPARLGPEPTSSWTEGEPYLDLLGEVCPFTFVRTKLLLEELELGARVRLLIDHAPAAVNVPRSAQAWGQRVLGVHPLPDGRWHIDLQKLRD